MGGMADGKRVGAVGLAQSGAFAIVLIIGAFSSPGHPAGPHHTPPSSARQTQSVLPRRTATPGVTLTITASSAPSSPFQGRPVKGKALYPGQLTRDAPPPAKPAMTTEAGHQDHSYLEC